MLPINEYCRQMIEQNPNITPAEMLRNLHIAGYDREQSVLIVKHFFEDTPADEMCRIIVNEYNAPLIDKAELRRLLILCKYNEDSVDEAIKKHFPKPLGFVMMLDDSVSMNSAIAMVKIDAKAFLRCSRTGDQFGLNKFETTAAWLYPAGSSPVVVTEGRTEIGEAENAIETLSAYGCSTNISSAIQLANQMIDKSTADLKAFILLSDGEHNTGEPKPEAVLQNEPPVYIAGLGYWMRREYFEKMLDKNAKSQFYNSPTANDMMTIFNQIISDSTQSVLTMNDLSLYNKGSDYVIKEFNVLGEGNDTIINAVWSDKKYQYTSGYPASAKINIVLIDPNGKKTDIKPIVAEDGFCIFRLCNVKPGRWKILSQYSIDAPIYGTSGAIAFGTGIQTNVLAPAFAGVNETFPVELSLVASSNIQFENIAVTARISQPLFSMKEIMSRYGDRLFGNAAESNSLSQISELREQILQQENRDIFERRYEIQPLAKTPDDRYMCNVKTGSDDGIYNVSLTITGTDTAARMPFTCFRTHSMFVG
jgi:hypothetical protein